MLHLQLEKRLILFEILLEARLEIQPVVMRIDNPNAQNFAFGGQIDLLEYGSGTFLRGDISIRGRSEAPTDAV